jgi:histidinol-phosphate aminotransferase
MEFPTEAVLAELKKKPRVFFLANPNNPTGTLVPKETLLRLLKAATHTAVVFDEAYSDFSGITGVPWIRKFPQLFIAKTFSKAAGLAGLRLGAVIAQRDSLSLIKRALPPFPVNSAALAAATAAVAEGSTIQKYIRNVKLLREWFLEELRSRGMRVFPATGNFVLADFGKSGPATFRKFARAGILVRERRSDMGPGFVRITIGTREELSRLLRLI